MNEIKKKNLFGIFSLMWWVFFLVLLFSHSWIFIFFRLISFIMHEDEIWNNTPEMSYNFYLIYFHLQNYLLIVHRLFFICLKCTCGTHWWNCWGFFFIFSELIHMCLYVSWSYIENMEFCEFPHLNLIFFVNKFALLADIY